PTRSWPWPGGSSGRSRSQSRAVARWTRLPLTAAFRCRWAARTSSVEGDGIGAGPGPAPISRVQNPECESGTVARVVDADRRDRDAGRHLRDGEQGVEAVEDAETRAERDADDGKVGVSGYGTR